MNSIVPLANVDYASSILLVQFVVLLMTLTDNQ
jgi:hypothetical protein